MEKSKQLVISEYVLLQLEKEYKYFAQEYSVEFAEKFRIDFFKEIDKILPMYKKYPECRFLKTKEKIYRNIIWNSYVIIYKITEESNRRLSLFHTKQNPKKITKLKNIK